MAYRGLASPIYEELGNLQGQAIALNNLGIDYYYEGDWAKALHVYERSRVLFERIGDVTSVAMATNNIGEILSDQGKLDEADELFHTVRHTIDPTGNRLLSTVSRLNLGRAAARAGRFAEADELLSEAARRIPRDPCDQLRAGGPRPYRRGRCSRRRPRAGAPRGAVGRAVEPGRPAGSVPCARPPRPWLRLSQLRQPDDAAQEFEQSIEAAREGDALYELALSLRAQEGLRGETVEAGERNASSRRCKSGPCQRCRWKWVEAAHGTPPQPHLRIRTWGSRPRGRRAGR